MSDSIDDRNSAAPAALDSYPDSDDTAQEELEIKAEIEDLLENVYIYLMEGRYQEGMSANQKRVIRKKAANFRIVNGEMIFKKKCRGKDKESYGLINFAAKHQVAS